jgi:hypothetical protein
VCNPSFPEHSRVPGLPPARPRSWLLNEIAGLNAPLCWTDIVRQGKYTELVYQCRFVHLPQAPGQAPNVSVWFTLVGVIFSFFSTFLAQGLRR